MNILCNIDQAKWQNVSYIYVIGIIFLFAVCISVFGANGLIGCIIASIGVIITPYIWNKPQLFLFLALFVYPFTRLFSLEDKFVITAFLYATSIPCAIPLIKDEFQKLSKISSFIWFMALYSFIILAGSLVVHSSSIEVFKEAGRMYFAIFVVLSTYKYLNDHPENITRFCKWIAYMFNAIALVAIGQYVTKSGGYIVEGYFRARGTFHNFNEYGYVISIFTCLALYFLFTRRLYKEKVFWFLTISLNLLALFTTLSKTSLILTAMVFIAMCTFLSLRKKIQLIGVSAVLGTGFLVYLNFTGMINVIISRFADVKSLLWRFEIWNTVKEMILQGNILLGQGANASREFLQYIIPAGESFAPHNIYLETIFNYGLIAGIPFILIFAFLIIKGFNILFDKRVKDKTRHLIGVSIITITLVTMIQNFVSNAFYDRAVNVIFWAIITVFICMYNQLKSDKHEEKCTRYEHS